MAGAESWQNADHALHLATCLTFSSFFSNTATTQITPKTPAVSWKRIQAPSFGQRINQQDILVAIYIGFFLYIYANHPTAIPNLYNFSQLVTPLRACF